MKKILLSAVALAAMTTVAYAEPIKLDTAHMDSVTAAGPKFPSFRAPKRHAVTGPTIQVAVTPITQTATAVNVGGFFNTANAVNIATVSVDQRVGTTPRFGRFRK